MALRVPESKFRDHFSIQTSPQNPQKATSGTRIGPRKVIFGHFAFFWYFGAIFQATRAIFFKFISTHQKLDPDKKENFSQLLKHQNQRKNTSPLTNFHFYYFQPYLLPMLTKNCTLPTKHYTLNVAHFMCKYMCICDSVSNHTAVHMYAMHASFDG